MTREHSFFRQFCALALSAVAQLALAGTNVGGPVTVNTTWSLANAPYTAISDVTIDSGAVLTIEAGVTVFMNPGTNLIVKSGALAVQGTATLPVVITSYRDITNPNPAPAPGDWGQLRFLAGTNASTSLNNVNIKYGSGLSLTSASPALTHVNIQNHNAAAVSVDLQSSPIGSGLIATGNTLNGILVPAGDVTGTVTWGLKGIPYVVAQGVVVVGQVSITITPAMLTLDPNSSGTLHVTLANAAPAGGLVLDVSSSAPSIASVPASLTVVAGSTSADLAVNALSPGTSTVSVGRSGLGSATATVQVNSLPALTLAPANTTLHVGQVVPMTVSSPIAAPVAGLAVTLTSANSTALSVPPTVTISSGATSAGFNATGLASGVVSITAAATGYVSANAQLTIIPMPVVSVTPLPLAIPPDNVTRSITLSLSSADVIDNTFAVSIDQPSIATIAPSTVTIAAGQTQVPLQITGKTAGQTTLRLASATLGNSSYAVYVTTEFQGLNTVYAPLVGVQFGDDTSTTTYTGTLASDLVGVTIGTTWTNTSPRIAAQGSTTTLTFAGVGLPANLAVSLQPSDGITLGALSVAADGSQATVPITVDASAPTTTRRIVLTSAAVALTPAQADANQLDIVAPLPEIISITPLIGAPGSTIANFIVRGRNLFDAQTLIFQGGNGGVTVGATPTVSADGTELSTSVAIAASASAGVRTVIVRTLSGDSSSTATSANTFNVNGGAVTTYAPLMSPLVGVQFGDTTVGTSFPSLLASPSVGIVFGPAVVAVSPRTGAQGQSLSLTLLGQGLTGITSVTLSPNTGVSMGAINVAADGLSATVAVSIAATAPLGARGLQVLAGTTSVIFAGAESSQFTVTAPMPQLASIEPTVVAVGVNSVSLTLRGQNFQNAIQVRVNPADGISISPPSVSVDGTTASVTLSIAANAVPGSRVVSLITPAGETNTIGDATNTLLVTATAGTTYAPIVSPLVGVVLGESDGGASFVGTLASALVGVQYGDNSIATSFASTIAGSHVGIVVGSVATGIDPLAIIGGASATLTIAGIALPSNSAVSITPNTGLTLGAPTVATDGSTIILQVTAAGAAPTGPRTVAVTSGTSNIAFAPPSASTFVVSAGAPTVVSLSPILAHQGETIDLTINGTRFDDFVEVIAEPNAGVTIDSQPVVNAAKTQISLKLRVEPTAQLGARVIRVHTLGGTSTSTAAPANTFTVYSP